MSIQTLNIPIRTSTSDAYIKEGDTIPAINFSFDALDDIDLTGAEIKMQLYKNTQKVFDVSSSASGITIIDSKSFRIDTVPKELNTLTAGTILGDLEITIDGVRFTYFNVVYTVIKQYTK